MSFLKRDIRPLGRPLAVFDVDETLIWEKSMFSFLRFFLRSEHGWQAGDAKYKDICAALHSLSAIAPRETVNRAFYEVLKGQKMSHLQAQAEKWFAQIPAQEWFIPEVLATLRVHQQHGHRIALLSGSADFILKPVCDVLAPDDVLAITLEQSEEGICTGQIAGLQTIGAGKTAALQTILDDVDNDPIVSSFGYGDHESDAPFLAACDVGFVVTHRGSSKRPDWAQDFHPVFVDSSQKPTASPQTESYANV